MKINAYKKINVSFLKVSSTILLGCLLGAFFQLRSLDLHGHIAMWLAVLTSLALRQNKLDYHDQKFFQLQSNELPHHSRTAERYARSL